MPDRGWKQFERRVARDHGCERAGPTGKADVDHPLFSIECKLVKAVPRFLVKCMSQAVSHTKDGKVPVVVMKLPHKRDDDAVVVLRYKDWVELHGTVK